VTISSTSPRCPLAAQPVDIITNNGFEDPSAALGFAAISSSDGSVAHTTVNPIAGTEASKSPSTATAA
jgi:hypothetical protein